MHHSIRSSSKKNTRMPSTMMTKSSNPQYTSSSIQKEPRFYQIKTSSKISVNQPPTLNYTYKSTLKENNNNVYTISEKYDRLYRQMRQDQEAKEKQRLDKNKFRIRDSKIIETPTRNDDQDRTREMQESLKRQNKQKKDKEKSELQKIKSWDKQFTTKKLDSNDLQTKLQKRQKSNLVMPKTLGLVGLMNIGNTCFMNSILQCLFNLPDFNDYFLENRHASQVKYGSKVANTYAKTIKIMRTSNSRAQNPSDLKSAIGEKKPRFSGYAQQDAQQFLVALLQLMSSDLNRSGKPKYRQLTADTTKQSLLQISQQWWKYNKQRQDSHICDFFTGQMLSKVVCSRCKYESIAFDNFWDLALDFSRSDNGEIIKMLQNFLKPQTIANDYYCSKCKTFRQCTRKVDFFRLPKILVCELKRFSYGHYRKVKLNNKVRLPIELNLQELISQSRHRSVNNPIYDLVGLVNHSGDIDFGHYTADCKNPINGKWYHFNDSSVNETYMRNVHDSSSPYLVFYAKRQ